MASNLSKNAFLVSLQGSDFFLSLAKCPVVEIYRTLLLMEGVLLLAGPLVGQSFHGRKSDMTLKLRPFVTLRSGIK
jgi:hypothetical protein